MLLWLWACPRSPRKLSSPRFAPSCKPSLWRAGTQHPPRESLGLHFISEHPRGPGQGVPVVQVVGSPWSRHTAPHSEEDRRQTVGSAASPPGPVFWKGSDERASGMAGSCPEAGGVIKCLPKLSSILLGLLTPGEGPDLSGELRAQRKLFYGPSGKSAHAPQQQQEKLFYKVRSEGLVVN